MTPSTQRKPTPIFAFFMLVVCTDGFFIPFLLFKKYNLKFILSNSAFGTDTFQEFSSFIEQKQEDICKSLEDVDGKGRFVVDDWQRSGDSNYGQGSTRVMENGNAFEKAAVSVSIINGILSAERAQSMASRSRTGINPMGGQRYSAAALSLVLHSASPMVPTFRSDVRYFQVEGHCGWFGGGADLTPFYLCDADISEFHRFYSNVCSKYDETGLLYQKLKKWCDDYFYIPIRNEHRGTGGIFFDDLQDADVNNNSARSFTEDVANSFMASYLPIVKRWQHIPYTSKQRDWQLLRRGRYLEFNLLYDRGVKFGLNGGRVESVMVSAPPLIAWKYNVVPEQGSEEQRLVSVLQKPKDWIM